MKRNKKPLQKRRCARKQPQAALRRVSSDPKSPKPRRRQESSTMLDAKERRRGAPVGNNNAFKHGYYSTRALSIKKTVMESSPRINLSGEASYLRSLMQQMIEDEENSPDSTPESRKILVSSVFTIVRELRLIARYQTSQGVFIGDLDSLEDFLNNLLATTPFPPKNEEK